MRTQPEDVAADDYQAAFVQAYEKYFSRVFAYIYNRLNSVEVAQDLTAEVFEKAYTKGHGLRERQAYVAWLFMIAKNTVAGYFRKRKREQAHLERIKQSFPRLTPPDEPVQRAIRNEAVAKIIAFSRLLSPREQELLSLKFDGELTNEEIARVMGMSAVNVRVTLFRALTKLRNKMKEMSD